MTTANDEHYEPGTWERDNQHLFRDLPPRLRPELRPRKPSIVPAAQLAAQAAGKPFRLSRKTLCILRLLAAGPGRATDLAERALGRRDKRWASRNLRALAALGFAARQGYVWSITSRGREHLNGELAE